MKAKTSKEKLNRLRNEIRLKERLTFKRNIIAIVDLSKLKSVLIAKITECRIAHQFGYFALTKQNAPKERIKKAEKNIQKYTKKLEKLWRKS